MNQPIRIQRRRADGLGKYPPNTKRVTRYKRARIQWGNPSETKFGSSDVSEEARADRARVVALYEAWLIETPEGRATADLAKIHLRGKNLACSCPLDGPCHGNVLLRIANEDDPEPAS